MAPTSDDLTAKANALAQRGRHKRALKLYEKAGNYAGVGHMHEKLGQIDPAIESYIRAGQFVRAAELLVRMGEHERAARMFAKASEYRRAGSAFLEADKAADAAKMFERAGDVAEAAELYERVGRFGIAASLYESAGMRERAILIYEENGRKELAARLCAQSGDYLRAAELYAQMEIYIEAARCFAAADRKEEAIDAYEKADAFHLAIELCEELGRFERIAQHFESLCDTERAVEYYAKAGRFAEAGRIYEEKSLFVQAARMYLKDKSMLARAGDLFEHAFGIEYGWQHKTAAQVWDIALAEGAGRIAVAMANSDVLVLDNEGGFLWRFRVPMGVRSRSAALSPDAACLAVGTEGRSVYTLDASNRLLWKRELGGEARGLAFADEGRMLVAGCTDGYVRAFNAEGKDVWSYQTDFKVWHLAVNDRERLVVAGTGDGHIYVFNYDGHILWKDKTDDWVSRVAVSPNGHYAAAVLGQSQVRMYDLADRTMLWEQAHEAIVQDVEFWTDGYLAIGANTELTIWDDMGRVVCREFSSDRITRVQRGQDGQTLYVGHFERGLQVVRLHDCHLLAARCYEEHGDYRGAARLYHAKNELTSAAKLYRLAGDHIEVAAIAERLNDYALAGESYEAAGQYERAGESFERAGQVERAIECFDKGGCKSKAGALLAGIGETRRAAGLKLEAGDFQGAGDLFHEAGATDDAIDAYEKALDAQRLTPDGVISLGRLYWSANRHDDAIKLVQPFRTDASFGAKAARVLADCFVAKKQYSIAIGHYRDALAGEDDASPGYLDTLYGLASACEKGSYYDEAIATFEKILLVDYYYRDVSGRIDRIREIGSVFRSTGSGGAGQTRITRSDSANGNATVAQQAPKRYEVLRKLGEGGMGIVYEARDTKLDRVVAMKVLPSKLSGQDELKSRFLREARAVAALSHENVVAVYDIGEEWGESYIAMEFIDGHSLREILAKKKKLAPGDALVYARQIVEGLSAAHRLGIIHRDIKPENVMVAKANAQVKLMDFGLARMDSATNLTMEGSVMGTWRYMAPEQVRGDRVGTAADVYAVGVMMFEMMAGRAPFTEGDLAYHHLNTEPPILSDVEPAVTQPVSDVVAQCLIKDADQRIPDAMALAEALQIVMPKEATRTTLELPDASTA